MTAGTIRPVIGIDASRAAIERQTGTERYSRRIIQEILDQGVDQCFRLYVNGNEPISLSQRVGTQQRLIPFPRLWTHVRLSAELAMHPVDALFIPAHVVPPIHPSTTVVTIHDLGYLHEPESHADRSRAYLDWSTRWSVRAAQRIIAISQATKNDLMRFYGVPPSKVTVVYHGVDTQFRRTSDDEINRAKRNLGIAGPFILFVGTVQPRKNLVRLISAFDTIADRYPDIQLVLAGKMGWKTDEIVATASRSPYLNRIKLPGHVPDADLPALYSAAELFALPSLYEGFGMPVLEAMACGTPVLISDRGALPEIGGDSAVIVDPTSVDDIANGLRQLLDEEPRERRIDLSIKRAAEFTWTAAGRRTLETILACIQSPLD